MNSKSEEQRIRNAYARYDSDPSERAKRDPSNRGLQIMREERDQALRRLLASMSLPSRERLCIDIGCGDGSTLGWLSELGAEREGLVGVDILENRIALARELQPGIRFEHVVPDRLPFADQSFALALAFTLFSSILDDSLAEGVAQEIGRLLRPGGSILWYDTRYANPGNRDVRGVSKRAISRLFPNFQVALRSITLLPPLARRLGAFSDALYPVLAQVPPLRARYIGVISKPA
jgi:SAM-dependent methyltransferase